MLQKITGSGRKGCTVGGKEKGRECQRKWSKGWHSHKSYIFLHVNAQYFVFVCVSFVYECIALCMFACIPVFCVTIWLSLVHPCECAVWQYVYECVWWVWGCLGNHCGQQSGIMCEICVFVRIYSWIWLFRVPLSFSLWVCTSVCACVFFFLSQGYF